MDNDQKNTNKKGQIALLKVETRAVEKGFVVSRPSEGNRYDLVVDTGSKLLKSQIKYLNATHKTGKGENLNIFRLNLRKPHSKKNYTKKEIDCVLCYLQVFDVVLKFSSERFHEKSVIYINVTEPKSKNYYKKYLW